MQTESNKYLTIALLISICISCFLYYDKIDGPDSNQARLERAESLINYTRFFYMHEQYGITTNYTLEDVKGFYLNPSYRSFKTMSAYTMFDYICDGKNEEVIELMLE